MKLILSEYGLYNWGKGGHNKQINNQGNNMINFEIMGYQLMEPRMEFSCFLITRWINERKDENVSGYYALDKNGNFNANGYGLMIWITFSGIKW